MMFSFGDNNLSQIIFFTSTEGKTETTKDRNHKLVNKEMLSLLWRHTTPPVEEIK
jgi:hypothetical protein